VEIGQHLPNRKSTIHNRHSSILLHIMNIPSLHPFAAFAALRFRFFPSTPRAVGNKWADPAGRALPFFCVLALTSSLQAATTITETFTVNTPIPDNSDLGLADYRNISAPGLTEIESITVGLNFTGGWNGDLYAHLSHSSGFSVLLNRPGRTSGNPDGAGSFGMTILLDDTALSDIHTAIANSGLATGTYQPDARTKLPHTRSSIRPMTVRSRPTRKPISYH
jgi:hypothetical protein